MRNLILILIATFLLIGCKEEAPTENSLTYSMESYLPLHVGNEWVYKSTRKDSSSFYIKVLDTIVIDKTKYFILTNNFRDSMDTTFIRTSDGTKFYSLKKDEEYIYRIFKDTLINENLSYNSLSIKNKIYFASKDKIDLEFGSYENYIEVEEGDFSRDAGTKYYYIKGIGLAYYTWFKGRIELKYAKVNNVEYGERKE
jgi:hypothetical protein